MTSDSLRAAQNYLSRGWYPIPVPRGEKRPDVYGWQKLRLIEAELPHYFSNGQNIGLLLGEPSGGLVDVDLDAPEAIRVAVAFLPPTDLRHGRDSKPHSHWWYQATGVITKRYKDVDGTCLVELRSTGAQTIVSPSLHPSGEAVIWHADGGPARVDSMFLSKAVACVAACALLARHWPDTPGSRHELALAVGGYLTRGGLDVDTASLIVERAAQAAGDEEVPDRVRAVRDTERNFGAGRSVTGAPTLSLLIPHGEKISTLLWAWLGLKKLPREARAVETAALQTNATCVTTSALGPGKERPKIHVRPDIPSVVDEAIAALAATRSGLFQRARLLVRVERDPGGPRKGIARPPNAPVIAAIPSSSLRELMSASAQWVKFDKGGDKVVLPPTWVASALADRRSWPFPELEGVVEAPCLHHGGAVVDRPGYDESSGLFYDPGPVTFDPVSASPTPDDARRSLERLLEMFHGFPFQGGEGTASRPSSDRSAALAAAMTLFARPAISGPIPLFAVRAPAAGTGKSLLVDALAVLLTGRPAARMFPTDNEDEERKRILALALGGAPLVLIDNVENLLGSPALASALTAGTVQERLLMTNRMVTVRMDSVWFATGNNMAFRGDLGRRVVPIDLDAGVELPEERRSFLHDPLLHWVQTERGRLVADVLTIHRAFVVAGRPQPGLTPFGSFEGWSRTIRAPLVWLGEPDPIAGRERIRATAEPERDELVAVLRAWHAQFGEGEKTLAEAVAQASEPLREALAALDRKSDGKGLSARRLGYTFRRHNRRIVAGLRLLSGMHALDGTRWRVTQISGQKPEDADDHDDDDDVSSPGLFSAGGREDYRNLEC